MQFATDCNDPGAGRQLLDCTMDEAVRRVKHSSLVDRP